MKNIAWIYLIIASLMEILWMVSLKYLNMKDIRELEWIMFFRNTIGIKTIFPLLGYIIFGLLNVYFISLAMKSIPMSMAFAVWMGLALFGSTCLDVYYFKQSVSPFQMVCLGLILFGVMGLKYSANQQLFNLHME